MIRGVESARSNLPGGLVTDMGRNRSPATYCESLSCPGSPERVIANLRAGERAGVSPID